LTELGAAQEIADRGHLEPGRGARLAAIVAARQSPPAAELGEGVLDLVKRGDRPEAGLALRRSLDVEPQVAAVGQGTEAPIAAVGDDRADAGQTSETVAEEVATDPDIVWPGRIGTAPARTGSV
jgi:arylamine N-acetyltransferase